MNQFSPSHTALLLVFACGLLYFCTPESQYVKSTNPFLLSNNTDFGYGLSEVQTLPVMNEKVPAPPPASNKVETLSIETVKIESLPPMADKVQALPIRTNKTESLTIVSNKVEKSPSLNQDMSSPISKKTIPSPTNTNLKLKTHPIPNADNSLKKNQSQIPEDSLRFANFLENLVKQLQQSSTQEKTTSAPKLAPFKMSAIELHNVNPKPLNNRFSAKTHLWFPYVERHSHFKSHLAAESYRGDYNSSQVELETIYHKDDWTLSFKRSKLIQQVNPLGLTNHIAFGTPNQEFNLSHIKSQLSLSIPVQRSSKFQWDGLMGVTHLNFSERIGNRQLSNIEAYDQTLLSMGSELKVQSSSLTLLSARYLRSGENQSDGEINLDELEFSITQRIHSLFLQLGYKSYKLDMEDSLNTANSLLVRESWEGPYLALLWNLN